MPIRRSSPLRTVRCITVIAVAMAGLAGCFDDSTSPRAPSSGENRAPTISGSPALSAKVGAPYVFVPTAADPDNDVLVFTVAGRPSWMTFSPRDGQLSGVPGATAVGRYDNIQIRVTDGMKVIALPAFSVVVTAAEGLGSATLRWQAPTQFTDGEPLTDLSGYRVVYGRARDLLDLAIVLRNPTVTSVVVDGLSSGTWYFAVTAITASGRESQPSGIVSKTIP